MDYMELMFAAQVRDLASSLRTVAFSKHFKLLMEKHDDTDERTIAMGQWDAGNPVSDFVPVALERIQQTALFIRTLPTAGM